RQLPYASQVTLRRYVGSSNTDDELAVRLEDPVDVCLLTELGIIGREEKVLVYLRLEINKEGNCAK
ncbi:MAG: hypothetical protein QOH96_2379, partial [Blastocatellia bacterium]|nr:hypothetical protein [Blastocatellia bacterium]